MATIRNQACITVPANLEDPAAVKFVLDRLIEQIDIIRGLRDSEEGKYITQKDLDQAVKNLTGTTIVEQKTEDTSVGSFRLLRASIDSLERSVNSLVDATQNLQQLYDNLNDTVEDERVPYPEEDGKMYVMKDKQWVELELNNEPD